MSSGSTLTKLHFLCFTICAGKTTKKPGEETYSLFQLSLCLVFPKNNIRSTKMAGDNSTADQLVGADPRTRPLALREYLEQHETEKDNSGTRIAVEFRTHRLANTSRFLF